MRKNFLVLCLFLTVTVGGLAGCGGGGSSSSNNNPPPSTAESYFPLEIGNTWFMNYVPVGSGTENERIFQVRTQDVTARCGFPGGTVDVYISEEQNANGTWPSSGNSANYKDPSTGIIYAIDVDDSGYCTTGWIEPKVKDWIEENEVLLFNNDAMIGYNIYKLVGGPMQLVGSHMARRVDMYWESSSVTPDSQWWYAEGVGLVKAIEYGTYGWELNLDSAIIDGETISP